MKIKSIILLVALLSLLFGCATQDAEYPEKYHHRGFNMGAEFGDPAFKASRVLGTANSVVVR